MVVKTVGLTVDYISRVPCTCMRALESAQSFRNFVFPRVRTSHAAVRVLKICTLLPQQRVISMIGVVSRTNCGLNVIMRHFVIMYSMVRNRENIKFT